MNFIEIIGDPKKIGLIVVLIGFFILAAILPAAATGFHGTYKQTPPNKDALFITSNGTCIPMGAQKYINFFNAAATWAGNNHNVTVDPKLLIAMAQAENDTFEPSRPSPVGAIGLMQLMPGTFSEQRDPSKKNDITDPEANIYAGANYLALGLQKYADKGGPPFSGSPYSKLTLDFMIAGYNAGYGTTDTGTIPKIPETLNHIIVVEKHYRAIIDCLKRSDTSNIPENAPEAVKKVLAAARAAEGDFPGQELCEPGVRPYCGQQAMGVYIAAGMQKPTYGTGGNSIPNPTTHNFQSGDMVQITTTDANHMIILDSPQTYTDSKGKSFVGWSYWGGDRRNPWDHSTIDPSQIATWKWPSGRNDIPFRPGPGGDPVEKVWTPQPK